MKKITTILLGCFIVLASMAQTTYYVKTDGNDANNGTSWATAFATISKAITTAVKNDEIRIKEGTYISTGSYIIDKTLTIKGGYGADEAQNYNNKTVLDGNNSHKIIQVKAPITGGPAVVTLDGLVFKNASFAGNSYGGAVEYVKATGTVSNCTFTNNTASAMGGGALAFVNSTTKNTVANCRFDGNSGKSGGAIYCGTQTVVDIVNCTIANNTCDTGIGGGICSNGVLNLKNSILWGNKKGTDTDQIKGNGKFNLEHNVIQDGVWLDYIQPNLQSNMVLQQNSNFTISGKSTPSGQIKVQCSWEAEAVVHTTTVSASGLWSITVQTPAGSFDSRTITVEGKQKTVFDNILVGEVWLCSGQSNMLFRVKDVDNGAAEVVAADAYPISDY
jgi:predicted outer membrane repeat protein